MSREQGLAQAFVELADAGNGESDDIYFLNVLARNCVDLVGWSAIAVLLANHDRILQIAATWPDGSELPRLLEHPNEEGPCVDAYRGRLPVRLDLAKPAQTAFARNAVAAGYAAVHAFPLCWRDETIGSYALFGTAPAELVPEDLELTKALAEVATMTILHRRELQRAETVAQQLQGALNSRVVIEQAKGMLAERSGLDMEGAFDILRSHARKNRMRLAAVARDVVEGKIRPEVLLARRVGSTVIPPGRARPTDLPPATGRGRDRRR
jgi:ANTAR domain